MTNVKSLLAFYVQMGGSLTDTYSDIAGGIPVGQYMKGVGSYLRVMENH